MLLPALFLPILAAASGQPTDTRPVVVTGRAWAPFISPMGEPFRARSATDDTLARWFNQADRNHDGLLTPDEIMADADRFFATLDTDENGADRARRARSTTNGKSRPTSSSCRATEARAGRSVAGQTAGGCGRNPAARRPRRDRKTPTGSPARSRVPPATACSTCPSRSPRRTPTSTGRLSPRRIRGRRRSTASRCSTRAHRGQLTLGALEAMWPAVLSQGHEKQHRPDAADARVGDPLPLGRTSGPSSCVALGRDPHAERSSCPR